MQTARKLREPRLQTSAAEAVANIPRDQHRDPLPYDAATKIALRDEEEAGPWGTVKDARSLKLWELQTALER